MMTRPSGTRHLAALMFTDMVGYSALARSNETLAKELVAEQRALIRSILPFHGGQEQQTTGDGFFIEFGSVIDAIECAIEIQNALHERSFHAPKEREIKIRIGVHLAEVFLDQNQLFGNGVNIAARIEALSPEGSVCFTRQVFDLVHERVPVKIKRVGKTPLKNIRGGAELYHLVFPWMESKKKRSAFDRLFDRFEELSPNSLILGGLFAGCLAILLSAATLTWQGVWSGPESSRSPASEARFFHILSDRFDPTPRRVELSEDWTYALDQNGRAPGNLPSPPSDWKKFDAQNAWKYANEIQGRYWLKKTFEIRYPFETPAIVLGPISDTHRVFLNGKFVGGSDHVGDLAYYVFDMSLLNLEGPNTLLVSANTRPTLNPGLDWSWIPGWTPFLGEFEDVKRYVTKNQITYQVLQTVYFTLSFAIFAASFLFAMFRRERRDFLYCSLFLLLSTLYFSYCNLWISSVLSYPFLRFLKAIALTLQPFVLLSAYFHLRDKREHETFNNGAALGVSLAIAGVFLLIPHTPASFMSAFNTVITCAITYTGIWVLLAGFTTFKAKQRRTVIESMTVAFGFLSLLSLLGAWRLLPAFGVSIQVKDVLSLWTMASPFVFSICLLIAATLDYSVQSETAERKRSRDQLALSLIRIVHGPSATSEMIGAIQERVTRFLKARRSTLYVIQEDSKDDSKTLKATFILGDRESIREVRPTLQPSEGPLWYACTHKSPLLIQDIRSDLRFHTRPMSGGYRTGSCMIFPLISGDRLAGALTFADKVGEAPFSRDDFAMALEVAKDLSLLLDNRRLQENLKKAANSAD